MPTLTEGETCTKEDLWLETINKLGKREKMGVAALAKDGCALKKKKMMTMITIMKVTIAAVRKLAPSGKRPTMGLTMTMYPANIKNRTV